MRFPIYAKPRLEKLLGEAVANASNWEKNVVQFQHLISPFQKIARGDLLAFYPSFQETVR
jgi:hypothetical protein